MTIKGQNVVVYTKYYGYVNGILIGYSGDGVYKVNTNKGIIESNEVKGCNG